ncbi:MAG: DUF2167 domain-containing protein [Verrucomicrobiales bacterium]|nr:DUF2167 domain-containing protein [Verrucomicrobiales bacterium]
MKPLVNFLVILSLLLSSAFLSAQDEANDEAEFLAAIDAAAEWERNGTGEIGKIAKVAIPQGYRFTGEIGTEQILAMMGNPPSETRKGLIGPADLRWFAVFDWDARGYVKDDDKDELNPDELLKDLKKINKQSSAAREEAGYGKLDLVGWAYPPHYNEQTNNLEWALDLVDENGERVVNYQTKLLGRRGVMEAVLVCGPDQLEAFLPEFQSMLQGYEFSEGQRYTEFVEGDKVAKGGLVALIAGGAVFAAAKTGLLSAILLKMKKLWIFVVAAIAGIFRWFKSLFTGRAE